MCEMWILIVSVHFLSPAPTNSSSQKAQSNSFLPRTLASEGTHIETQHSMFSSEFPPPFSIRSLRMVAHCEHAVAERHRREHWTRHSRWTVFEGQ